MTRSLPETIAWIVAAVLVIPVLINPVSWPIAVALAVLVIVGFYVGRYVLDLEKQRRMGERMEIADVRQRAGGRDDQ